MLLFDDCLEPLLLLSDLSAFLRFGLACVNLLITNFLQTSFDVELK